MTRLRDRADRMTATATALKKIADAADPLYKTLDDGQKRRLAMLTHHGHHRRRRRLARAASARKVRRRRTAIRTPGGCNAACSSSIGTSSLSQAAGNLRRLFRWGRDRSAAGLAKVADSGAFSGICAGAPGPGKCPQVCWTSQGRFAKRRRLVAGLFRTGSGRIAQLVEQLTLNQRVPGSSPGAPTNPLKRFATRLATTGRRITD